MVAAQVNTNLTLLDIAKRTDPTGAVPVIAELLSQKNEIINDIPWLEGNTPTGTRNTLRTGLPQAYWKLPNTGTATSKSTTAQIDEACGILEAWSEVDFDVAQLNGNVAAYRLSELDAFVESMTQQLVGTLIYGNTAVNSERFMGLAPRYGAIASATNANNILNAGGSGSGNMSIWLVGWGPNQVYGIYPRGTMGGIQYKDFGEQVLQTSVTLGQGLLHAYVAKWQWKCGLAVKDWRNVVRCANILVSDLVGGTGTQGAQQLLKLMARMLVRLPSLNAVSPCFYMNRTAFSILMIMGLDKSQNILSVEPGLTQFGKPGMNMSYLGIPIRFTDQLLNTESAIA